jgi:hypothetical protein
VNPLDLAVVRRNLAPPSRSLPLIALAGALDTSTGPFSAVSVLAQGDAEGKILPT